MSTVQIQAIINLIIVIVKGIIQLWNSLDPKTRAKITKALHNTWDKIPEAIEKMKNNEDIIFDDLYLTKSAEDILKELEATDGEE